MKWRIARKKPKTNTPQTPSRKQRQSKKKGMFSRVNSADYHKATKITYLQLL